MSSRPDPAVLAGSGEPAGAPIEQPIEEPAGAKLHNRRPALDGVRAIAVLAVAVYHFGGGGSSWLPGGFLGVDVFFVLSGYLITGLLLNEHARTGRISLVGFWVRRVKRLAPALFLMLILVSAWIWWATPPADYPARRSDVFWTLGYLANWHLAGSETYFAAYGSVSPFRHTWSLAVEEQFYLVWPTVVLLTLLVGSRLPRPTRDWPVIVTGRRLLAAVGIVGAALSVLAFAQLYDSILPSIAYYSTRGRVQELFAGALLAVLFSARPQVVGRRFLPYLGVLGGLGLAGVAAGFLLMPDTAPFYYHGGALAVSLAAVLLIGGVERAPDSRLARALSWRPAVWLGRISYGVYLWHWPITVAVPLTGSTGEKIALQALRVALTLGLSVASFHLLELPVQRSRRLFGSAPKVLVAIVASVALVVTTAVQATALPGTILAQATKSADRGCPGERNDNLLFCVWPQGANAGEASSATPPELAIVGDSTVRGLSRGLDTWAKANGTTWIESAWKQCSSTGALMPTGDNMASVQARTCHQQARPQLRRMLSTYRPKTVLIGEFWISEHAIQTDDGWLEPGTAAHRAAMRTMFTEVVDEIARYGGRAVFLELPPPGDQMGLQFAKGRPAEHSKAPVAAGGKYVPSFNRTVRDVVAARPGVASTVSVTDQLCPGGPCPSAIGDELIRMDGVHYTIPYAAHITPIILARAGVTG